MKKTSSFSHSCKKVGQNKFSISWIQHVQIARGETIPVRMVKVCDRKKADRFCNKHKLFFHDRTVSNRETKSQRRRRYYLHLLMKRNFTVNAYTKTIQVDNISDPLLKKYGSELVKMGYNLQLSMGGVGNRKIISS